jgi:hypothetical protein
MDEVRRKDLGVLLNTEWVKTLIIPFSFTLPILILYLFYPSSFLVSWKGRALYVFFLWLALLEFAFSWKKLPLISSKQFRLSRALIKVIFMAIPTIYALAIFYTDLKQPLIELGRFLGVPFGGIYGSVILARATFHYSAILSPLFVSIPTIS